MSQRTLYILYNADGTILGKLRYGYRKLSNKSDTEAACAVGDLMLVMPVKAGLD